MKNRRKTSKEYLSNDDLIFFVIYLPLNIF